MLTTRAVVVNISEEALIKIGVTSMTRFLAVKLSDPKECSCLAKLGSFVTTKLSRKDVGQVIDIHLEDKRSNSSKTSKLLPMGTATVKFRFYVLLAWPVDDLQVHGNIN